MDGIHFDILHRAEFWLILTTLVYMLINGAQIFETVVIVPKWTAAPPESLQIFKGKHGLDFKPFWIVMHSVHEITFILAIIFCWNFDFVRNWLLVLFSIHFGVRIWTLLYFVPRIMTFQKVANGEIPNPALAIQAKRWRNLNYVRVGLFIAISLAFIPLCERLLTY